MTPCPTSSALFVLLCPTTPPSPQASPCPGPLNLPVTLAVTSSGRHDFFTRSVTSLTRSVFVSDRCDACRHDTVISHVDRASRPSECTISVDQRVNTLCHSSSINKPSDNVHTFDNADSCFQTIISGRGSVDSYIHKHSLWEDGQSGNETANNRCSSRLVNGDLNNHFCNISVSYPDILSGILEKRPTADYNEYKYAQMPSFIVDKRAERNQSDIVTSCWNCVHSQCDTVNQAAGSVQADFESNTNHPSSMSRPCLAGKTAALLHSLATWTSVKTTWCRTWLLAALALVLLLLQVRRKGRRRPSPKIDHVLFVFCLLLSRCLASPWIEERGHSVKLRARFCQPVPNEQLRNMLGTAFVPDRMSSDDPFADRKRSDPNIQPDIEDAVWDSYYYDQQSDLAKDEYNENVDAANNHGEEGGWFLEEDAMTKDELQVVEKKDIVQKEGHIYQKQFEKQYRQSRYVSNQHEPTSSPLSLLVYMKRRKRAASMQGDYVPSSSNSDRSIKEKKDKDSFLPLRLLLSGRNRKLRRKLKKEFRKKARKLRKKALPWACTMSKVWLRLKEGYFPRYILDGRCVTDKCFYRLYDCIPQKYRIKVLQRDPDYCNPLPMLGANSTYEQKWTVVRYYVTVGCNCEAADPLRRPFEESRRL